MLCNSHTQKSEQSAVYVSILVLVDYALQQMHHVALCITPYVSILVLVDYALQRQQGLLYISLKTCFNPCFSGLCSATAYSHMDMPWKAGFNPCFSGLCSATVINKSVIVQLIVFQSLF